jgi:hypothetical protein
MNLIDLTLEHPQPRKVRQALEPHFERVDVERQNAPYQWCLVCRDKTDRIRLRVQYFFAAWFDYEPIYLICPGDRP